MKRGSELVFDDRELQKRKPGCIEGFDIGSVITVCMSNVPITLLGTDVGTCSISTYYYSESESEVAQSCLTLCDHIDCSLPGSSVHGIFQTRVLEWVAITVGGFYF